MRITSTLAVALMFVAAIALSNAIFDIFRDKRERQRAAFPMPLVETQVAERVVVQTQYIETCNGYPVPGSPRSTRTYP